MKITLDQIMALGPCHKREVIAAWFGTKRYATARQIAKDERVTHADRIWVLVRLMTPVQQVQWAVDCARRSLVHVKDEETAAICEAALQTAEAQTCGEATAEDCDGAAGAAWEAAEAARAADEAAWAAAAGAAEAAWEAAWEAAGAAEAGAAWAAWAEEAAGAARAGAWEAGAAWAAGEAWQRSRAADYLDGER